MALRSRNFGFLSLRYPILEALAAGAESDWRTRPVVCLVQLRMFAEQVAREGCRLLKVPSGTLKNFTDYLDALSDRGMPGEALTLFDALRQSGNGAVHRNEGTSAEALERLETAHELAVWFFRTSVDPKLVAPPFVTPDDALAQNAELKSSLAQTEKKLASLSAKAEAAEARVAQAVQEALDAVLAKDMAEKQAAQALEEKNFWEHLAEENEQLAHEKPAAAQQDPAEILREFFARADAAAKQITLTESDARAVIDAQLRAAGWEADSVALTYARGARPEPGRDRAIAEWPTRDGRADYALFAGTLALGMVEAKRANKDARGALDQAVRYCDAYEARTAQAPKGAPWGAHQLPFAFSTNGRDYLAQVETKSGVWFRDLRAPSNLPRALKGWYSPAGLVAELARDTRKSEGELASSAIERLGLRAYQNEAIRAVEGALAQGRTRCLVGMATGTGKTRTAVGLIYRLLEARRFRRVLFLVDRTTLGDQTHDVVKDYKVTGEQTLAQVFNVLGLEAPLPEAETKLHIATVQGLMARVLHAEPAERPAVDTYDCIVVDECHRGYTLDKEMSEGEQLYRDQGDYLSKYQRVIDHFDAVKIGLTATPAAHTAKLFGEPVFLYSYAQAVNAGYLVPHEPAREITTEWARDGITYRVGEQVTKYYEEKHSVENGLAEDEMHFEVDAFNRTVLVEGFNREVCAYLAREIDPTGDDKTIVFCVNDAHADQVTDLLSKAMKEQWGDALDADTVKKITGASERPEELVKRFKNERSPSVAVTVDLLSTGVDVPAVSNVVFLRRVKSRILYEQMLGRATRLCEKTKKEYFRIFDAVKQVELVGDLSTMKPSVVRPKHSFRALFDEVLLVPDAALRRQALDEIVAKARRKRRAVETNPEASARFVEESKGLSPKEFVEALAGKEPAEAAAFLGERAGVVAVLDETSGAQPFTVVHQGSDKLVGVRQNFEGRGPGDYLEDFRAFLSENMNKLPALMVVAQRPKELTRRDLIEVAEALERAGYREADLRAAHRAMTNEDVAAKLVGHIRHYAVGDALVPYEERVQRAVARVLKLRKWTAPQAKWIERIGKQLRLEVVVDRASLDEGLFKTEGGFARIDKVLEGELARVLDVLGDELWKGVG